MKKTIAGVLILGATATGGTLAADRAIDPYTDKSTHYELAIKSDIPQGERVEIHKDKAQMDLVGWNDEYKISIIPQIPTAQLGAVDKPFTVQANRPLLSKKMEFKGGDVTAFIEPKEGTENEFDIDFTLDTKPDTNVFTYAIEGAEEFDFFYQPALTQEEIDEGANRPDNVVGSYAVYHKTKANHRTGNTNYATGKVFHIYRPKAIDANGTEEWAELNYIDGILSVTVPQKFLDNASYPVVVDPTFGYETQGGTALSINDGFVAFATLVDSYTASTGDTITNYHFYGDLPSKDVTDNWEAVGYIYSGGVPTNWITSPTAFNWTAEATAQWNMSPTISHSMTNATDYVIGFELVETGTGSGNLYYDAGTAPGRLNSNSNLANPFVVNGTDSGRHYSIYATYTASAGGNPDPITPKVHLLSPFILNTRILLQ